MRGGYVGNVYFERCLKWNFFGHERNWNELIKDTDLRFYLLDLSGGGGIF
jgi:hypothetical protein